MTRRTHYNCVILNWGNKINEFEKHSFYFSFLFRYILYRAINMNCDFSSFFLSIIIFNHLFTCIILWNIKSMVTREKCFMTDNKWILDNTEHIFQFRLSLIIKLSLFCWILISVYFKDLFSSKCARFYIYNML